MDRDLDDIPALPGGYQALEVLSRREGVWVLRARRADAEEPVLLRLDCTEGSSEGLTELAVLAAVEHPGIAELLDHGPLPGGGRFVARRWVEGRDLGTWASENAPDPETVGAMLARLTPALDHLHREGFIHADLKPANVIVTPEGRPLLVDFGLARTRGEEHSKDGVSGSLFFLSPEDLLGLELTASADLFALGAMLHQLICGVRISPRAFYGHFPESSFLDATGTDPEELPEWSRDLVVGLTARDPGRRPRSAGAVGRQLADRLGVELETTELTPQLRWPVGQGREAWVAEWMNALETADEPSLWARLPGDEQPRPFWAHLRLYAALRGKLLHGLDLTAELRGITDSMALDRWAAQALDQGWDWIAVLVDGLDPWRERALLALERAARLVRRRESSGTPILVCVSGEASISPELTDSAVPPVQRGDLQAFVKRHFRGEAPERCDELAQGLFDACAGSATRLDQLLQRCEASGWIFDTGEGYRIRPGELSDPTTMLQDAATLEDLEEGEAELVRALEVCGGRAAAQHLREMVEDEEFGARLLRLRQAGWLEVLHRERLTEAVRRRRISSEASDHPKLRRLHGRRASVLQAEGGNAAHIAMHLWLAEPVPERLEALRRELETLLDRGRAESVLEIGDHLSEAARSFGMELVEEAPRLLVERARAWCSVGRTEMALKEIEVPALTADPEIAAHVELIRGLVASLRHETDAAMDHYEAAAASSPSVSVLATVGRIQLLHTLGKNEEVHALVEALDPEALVEQGRMRRRDCAYVRSMQAMGSLRLGQVDEARTRTHELVDDVRRSGDVQLEAALHINLAIIERLGGSLPQARSELEEAIRLYDRAGLVSGVAHARATLGGLLRDLGELVDAEPLLLSAMEIRERLNDPEGAGTARGMLALLYFERGHARAAIETLESTAEAMSGAQKRRHAPLLDSKAIEMRARIGDYTRVDRMPSDEESVDPRILLARARVQWIREDLEESKALAERAVSLARSLKQDRLVREAQRLVSRITDTEIELTPLSEDDISLSALDERIFELLDVHAFDTERAHTLAQLLSLRGKDDHAARMWFALAARSENLDEAKAYRTRAEESLKSCTRGLTAVEVRRFQNMLLGEPERWPGDFTLRSDDRESDEEFEMEVLRLLDINKQLVQQQDLDSLLGIIVEHALSVTGAERGFLVLEEHGELRFDTALDSARGDIAQPEFEISGSVVREALDRMDALRVSNAVDDPMLAQQNSVVSLELRSILCVPFAISGDLRGAIYVDHRLRKGAFDERSEKLCSLLANQAAVAIHQIKRMEEIRSLNSELEKRVVQKETDLRNARRALREAGASEPGRLVGKSQAIYEVQELLAKCAASDMSVLIVGESGTGKEVAATSLHEQSPRARGPFVSENCAALPASLIESELFGYRRGAFTGADRDRAGLFEQANAGTLFLDEIGELPLDLQAKFLRVLETGEVRRLGDEEARTVDFRLVVATNRNLEKEVREGRFRQDLFYRLEGLRVQMPTLGERPEDIELLVEHFLHQEEIRGGSKRRISKRVLSAMARRSWPGNVRELKNEISRLCVLCEGDIEDPSLVSSPAALSSELDDQRVVPILELERRAIRNALSKTGGDKRRAAEMLGISRAKIYQRLKEWRDEESGAEDSPPSPGAPLS